jgi:hypothetical protein
MRHLLYIVFLSIAVLVGGLGSSIARTWYVAADGSGDAPTIDAAVDSTLSGDVILVGPGTHSCYGVTLKPTTSLVSEFGPTTTVVVAADGPLQPGLISTNINCIVSGFTLDGGQIVSLDCSGDNDEAFNNIIHGKVQIGGTARFHHNLVDLPGVGSHAILVVTAKPVQIYNNIVLGEVVSSIPGYCISNVQGECNLIQEWPECFGISFGNFTADPLFCGVGNYYLRADSPCAPENQPRCGLIGPLPVGCGTVSVQSKSWGAVKALYRN